MSNNIQVASRTQVIINDNEISRVIYKDQPVLTFAMVDQLHQRVDGTASRAFKTNRARFIEGEDFYLVDFSQKDVFRPFEIKIPPRGLTILAQSGYAMLAKVFIDDLAWQVQRELVNKYFSLTSQHQSHPAKLESEVILAKAATDMLRMSDDSRLKMLHQIGEQHELSTVFLPHYTESRVTKSLTELLKDHGIHLHARSVNTLLIDMGVLELQTRPSSNGKNKQFKSLTEKGLKFGKNLVSPNNPRETQPHYYVDSFAELLNLLDNFFVAGGLYHGGAA